jgi:hypothetical protein
MAIVQERCGYWRAVVAIAAMAHDNTSHRSSNCAQYVSLFRPRCSAAHKPWRHEPKHGLDIPRPIRLASPLFTAAFFSGKQESCLGIANASWWQKVSMWMPMHWAVDGLDAMTWQASLIKWNSADRALNSGSCLH